jgi:hypothetical protein
LTWLEALAPAPAFFLLCLAAGAYASEAWHAQHRGDKAVFAGIALACTAAALLLLASVLY